MTLALAARTAAPADLGARLVAAGAALLERGHATDALPMLERAAALPDASPEAVRLLASALIEIGRPQDAMVALDSLLETAPGDAAAHLARARARRALKDRVGALDDAAAAVMAAPRDTDARQMLAMCLSEVGRHDQAILLFHELLMEAPEDPSRAVWLGTAFLRARRHEAAEELFAMCAERQPNARGIATLRVQNMLDGGEPQQAVALARAALERVGPDAALLGALGQALARLGDRAGAASAYAQAARLAPDDAYLRHMAAALDPASGVDRASDAYVRDLFDDYAQRFEGSLFALGYRVPGLMLRLLEELDPAFAAGTPLAGDILDLGCGTGLVGVALHDVIAGRLVGVDLSARMIEAARAKGIYAALHVAEIGAHLAADPARYAHVIAADVFCYFGALEATLAAAAARLAPGGRLLFTVERAEQPEGWELAGSARYRHSEAYVRAALAAAGLAPVVLRPEALRSEAGQPVPGLLVAAVAA